MTAIKSVNSNEIESYIEALEQELQKAQELDKKLEKKSSNSQFLERCLLSEDEKAEIEERKNEILCLIDRIEEYRQNKAYYQSIRAVEYTVQLIREIQEKNCALPEKVFDTIKIVLDEYLKHLNRMERALKVLMNPKKRNTREYAKSMEIFGEDLEDLHQIFEYQWFVLLEKFCYQVIQSARREKLKAGVNSKNEEIRRRIRYAAGFILNFIEGLEEEDKIEEEECMEDFYSILEWEA